MNNLSSDFWKIILSGRDIAFPLIADFSEKMKMTGLKTYRFRLL